MLDTGGSGGMFGQGDVRYRLLDVCFWNRDIGWTCGVAGAFKTADGGLTWRRVQPRPGRGEGYYHVEMAGPEDVWLLKGKHPGGAGNAWLLHSVDGGNTWREELTDQLNGYRDLYCRGSQRWVLGNAAPAFHSDDGGKTWRKLAFSNLLADMGRLAIPADVPTEGGFTVYVLGSYQRQPRLVTSIDGGTTWSQLDLPDDLPDGYWRYRPFFATSRTGWIGMSAGQILFTTDGGKTWAHRDVHTDQGVTALWFDQRGRGFAAVANGFVQDQGVPRMGVALYHTPDTGRTWAPVLTGKRHVDALFGRGPRQVWAVGDVPGFVKNDVVAILQ
ncbi:MAG: YCF48-related protein [Planctomycetota bacterium]